MDGQMRFRVMLEPRGFIRAIEFILAIVAFGTTGGYHSEGNIAKKCGQSNQDIKISVSYPFNLESTEITYPVCNGTAFTGNKTATLDGDFSPTSQWFVFVGVMAFLITLAAMIFYVAFESKFRENQDQLVTVGDLAITVLWTFLWLTAAAAWAWGVGQVKHFTSYAEVLKLVECDDASCYYDVKLEYGPLNASVAFAFLSMFVWAGNVWFVYKETPYHDDQTNLTPNEGGPNQQVPSNQT